MADIITISVSMPAEMQRLIMEQIKARFFGNISEYFRHLVREDLESQRKDAEREAPPASHRMNAISDAEVERLRRLYPLQAVERLYAGTSLRAPERNRLARILKVLRGEGTPEERSAWWDYTDLDFFEMLRLWLSADDNPGDSGGSRVKSPKTPKAGSGSARAKQSRTES